MNIDISGVFAGLLSVADDSEAGRDASPPATMYDSPFTRRFKIGAKEPADTTWQMNSALWVASASVIQQGTAGGGNLAIYVAQDVGTDGAGRYAQYLGGAGRIFWHSDVQAPTSGAQVRVFWPSPLMLSYWETVTENVSIDGGTPFGTVKDQAGSGQRYSTYAFWLNSEAIRLAVANGNTLQVSADAGAGLFWPAITYQITRVCGNYVAVKWRDELGAFQVWVFEYRTPNEVEKREPVTYRHTPASWETPAKANMLLSEYEETIAVLASAITTNEAKVLRGLANSPTVVIDTGSGWEAVAVQDVTSNIDPFNPTHTFSAVLRKAKRVSMFG
jgi:hypothetical protein